jgi:3-isopropylmalate/(R)-2-methylmalate dehydratase large subunit
MGKTVSEKIFDSHYVDNPSDDIYVLRDWARRHGISDFFDIGRNGVCHALFPEKGFVRPGSTIIMGDSHTCTYGAFGAFAAGVGTTDLEVGILKGVCAFHYPKTMKININGPLPAGVFAKDVILSIIAKSGLPGPPTESLNWPVRLSMK